MTSFYCEKGCCKFKINIYNHQEDIQITIAKHRKAGVFIYDPIENKILIVQSRGNLWGSPKGTLDYLETDRECAVREVKEETGLVVSHEKFLKVTKIRNKAVYFYMEKDTCEVEVQDHIPDNDVNGIGWVNLDCLETCINNGNITPSKHFRIIYERFIGRRLPYSGFILVERKKKRF